jgi:hypothetical protein
MVVILDLDVHRSRSLSESGVDSVGGQFDRRRVGRSWFNGAIVELVKETVKFVLEVKEKLILEVESVKSN